MELTGAFAEELDVVAEAVGGLDVVDASGGKENFYFFPYRSINLS